MSSTNEDNTKVHAEVEDFEDLGLGKSQNDDAAKFGERDPRQDLRQNKSTEIFMVVSLSAHYLKVYFTYRASHGEERNLCSRDSVFGHTNGEGPGDV